MKLKRRQKILLQKLQQKLQQKLLQKRKKHSNLAALVTSADN